MLGDDSIDGLLAEQLAYYRARAPEYRETAIPEVGGATLAAATRQLTALVEEFGVGGDVLELACGPASWTETLARGARSVTAVDGAPEMLAIARRQVHDARVRFVEANLFAWRPDRRYDAVFFGFWLSHVPPERFEYFWSLVAECLHPGGQVLFLDDGFRTPEELIPGAPTTVRRRLRSGSLHRVVKVPHSPPELERRLRELGWSIAVRQAPGPFYWGAGKRR